MNALRRVRRRPIKGIEPLIKENESDGSGCSTDTSACELEATIANDASSLTGLHLKSCMKVRTQRDSLSWGVQVDLPSSAPTIKVRFDTVEFRQYPIILSDNPSTSFGPPIGIGWDYDTSETSTVDIDLYEEECERDGHRRSRVELKVPSHTRVHMLKLAGYSRDEIADATKSVLKSKKQRRASLELTISERVDIMKHGIKGMIPGGIQQTEMRNM